jgi:hypothetical protein
MMNLQKLQGMGFQENTIAPYGRCVVVPGDKFDPDWEADLGDQGHKCFEAFLDKKPVMLVQIESKLTGTEENPAKVVYSPPLAAKEPNKQDQIWTRWSDAEDQRLLKRMSEVPGSIEEKLSKIFLEFPGRTPVAIKLHYRKLSHKQKAPSEPGSGKWKGGKGWTIEEDDILVELWKKKLKVPQIAPHLPNRSQDAVQDRLSALQTLGRIKPRWRKGEGKRHRSKVENVANVDNVAKGEKVEKKEQIRKADTCPECGLAMDLCCCDEEKKEQRRIGSGPGHIAPTHAPMSIPKDAPVTKDPIVSLLEEIRNLLTPQTYDFEYCCRNCGEHGHVCESVKIWEFCPVCGKPLIVWNVEA